MSKYGNPLYKEILKAGFELEEFNCIDGCDTVRKILCPELETYMACAWTSPRAMTVCWPGIFKKHGYDVNKELEEMEKVENMEKDPIPRAVDDLKKELGIKIYITLKR